MFSFTLTICVLFILPRILNNTILVLYLSQYNSPKVVSVFLEALLVGHEDWVTSVHWMTTQPHDNSNNTTGFSHHYRLFSTSMDRNMILWSPDADSGIWIPTTRFGDIGGQLGGSVGGNLLGFIGGCVSPDSKRLIGVGYGGAIHLWSSQAIEGAGAGAGDEEGSTSTLSTGYLGSVTEGCTGSERWRPVPSLSGHFNSVTDLAWSPRSDYLVSVSSDQTCRLFAPIQSINSPSPSLSASLSPSLSSLSSSSSSSISSMIWREVSRPQVHGYDLTCIAVDPDPSSFILYSGSDEKLIRVFDAPSDVINGLSTLCGITLQTEESKRGEGVEEEGSEATEFEKVCILIIFYVYMGVF